jgi:LDH2 family malate/lactate/ureidoglycolate dehydrogenase
MLSNSSRASDESGHGPVPSAVTVDPARLEAFVGLVLRRCGMGSEDARIAAAVMVSTDVRGQHTHGVWFLPRYVTGLRGGGIVPDARPEITHETAATALIDGHGGLGALVAARACEVAARKAREAGCATVLVRNSNHFGAAGYYSATLAEQGLVGFAASNSMPAMAAPGARARMLGSQPISFAAEDPDGAGPILLDMALSRVAGTSISQARERGEEIPDDWAVGSDGLPTTDPNKFFDGGALSPVGGYKGYGLAVFIEILCGVLSGAGVTSGVQSHHPTSPSNTGHSIIAIDVESFMPREMFRDRLAALRAELHAAPVAEGANAVMLPGEPEARHASATAEHGLDLEPLIWNALAELAADVELIADLESARL